MPVTRHFYISHQWLRELKRGRRAMIVAIYFRIPDDDPVWVGHYHQAHRRMTAAEAAAVIMASEEREGYEVIVPRRIDKKEIRRIKHLPQVTGWRYYPNAHGRRPCAYDSVSEADMAPVGCANSSKDCEGRFILAAGHSLACCGQPFTSPTTQCPVLGVANASRWWVACTRGNVWRTLACALSRLMTMVGAPAAQIG